MYITVIWYMLLMKIELFQKKNHTSREMHRFLQIFIKKIFIKKIIVNIHFIKDMRQLFLNIANEKIN